ncbi:MAG: DUF2911 domain-containing protein [Flavobacteriaceae bacterium]|nr:DUF2911 domain-containing protein [Flavobacteriaceae bacterium]
MKTFQPLLTLALLLIFVSSDLYGQLTVPRTSPPASVTQTVGVTKITIDYSRPSVNGRELWGNLVPYGMNNLGFGTAVTSPWRAGADENTTIKFTHDVSIEGKPVEQGKYGFHVVVNPNNTATIILSKDSDSWGSFFYNPAQDVVRVDIQTINVPFTEQLQYTFRDVTSNSAEALLSWGEKGFPFKIETNTTANVLAQFRQGTKGSMGFNRQNWEQAAAYSLNNGGDPEEALKWINMAIEGQFFSQKNVNNLAIKARILKKLGREQEYNQTLNEAVAIADQVQLNNLGYQMMTAKDFEKAKKFFEMAIEKDPNNANAYDSMGEYYKTVGNKEMAIKFFKKALAKNPPPNVKASSERHLKDLGAL